MSLGDVNITVAEAPWLQQRPFMCAKYMLKKGLTSPSLTSTFFSQEPTEICGPNGSGGSLSALSTLRTSGDILWYEDTLPWIKTLHMQCSDSTDTYRMHFL